MTDMIPLWLVVALAFGVNFAIWGGLGVLRAIGARLDALRSEPRDTASRAYRERRRQAIGSVTAPIDPFNRPMERPDWLPEASRRVALTDVAVLMAAHNEEVVLADSLAAITALVPREQVFVVSDGSTDATVRIAEAAGVNVTETPENVGKAGALEHGIAEFGLVERFETVLFLDADTRLDPAYFEAALPVFDDPEIVAVAGCAHSDRGGRASGLIGRLLLAHRGRVYSLTQRLLKYGQTGRRVNATHIVPGFASLYRTRVLPQIDMNPPGLVIEDFNMTFEIYRKRLGRVGFSLDAKAYTQDPDSLRDYVRQLRRWSLGLWQTARRHGLRARGASLTAGFLLTELLTASLFLLFLPVLVGTMALAAASPGLFASPAAALGHQIVVGEVTWTMLLVTVLIADYGLSIITAIAERDWRYLVYGLAFVPTRILDAGIAVAAFVRMWTERSTGRWTSPTRRAVHSAESNHSGHSDETDERALVTV